MRLKNARVTNFRSVEDSGEIPIDQKTCLVGKNEAGKTAVLQALYGLKPLDEPKDVYNVERDFPRRQLNDYKDLHPDDDAVVVSTVWTLDEGEIAEIAEQFGSETLRSPMITVYRQFNSDQREWRLDIDEKAAAKHLISMKSLNASESSQVGSPSTALALHTKLGQLDSRTPKQEELFSEVSALRDNSIYLTIVDILFEKLPSFMYFSHYDRMNGQLSIEQLQVDTGSDSVTSGDKVFVDFLEYAGTNIGEISQASTFESLNAKCEAASNKITEQIFEYWSQNDSLEIDVRVTRGEPSDPPPFNKGTVVRARVKNNLHKVSVPFSERSAGFIWFFSFLVRFAQVKKAHGNVIILLDEPGLTLHGKAQEDLLRYFKEQLEPNHQLVYSTHSPFMVPATEIGCVRIVEDVVKIDERNRKRSEGTKVSKDALVTDPDSLFPLQGALGYELTQALFVGPNTLLVEGPSDIVYIQAVSNLLKSIGETGLDSGWTIAPSAGVDKMMPLVSLFSANKINQVVLADVASGSKNALKRLESSGILAKEQIFRVTDFCNKDEGDIEDLFAPGFYVSLLNLAYDLAGDHELDVEKLDNADKSTVRLVKKAEAYFKVLPPDIDEFNHYRPAYHLLTNPNLLAGEGNEVTETLDQFRALFVAINEALR